MTSEFKCDHCDRAWAKWSDSRFSFNILGELRYYPDEAKYCGRCSNCGHWVAITNSDLDALRIDAMLAERLERNPTRSIVATIVKDGE